MSKRCQRCKQPATLHITEVLPKQQYEEYHFCETCAKKHVNGPGAGSPLTEALTQAEESGLKQCEHCGLKFVEFRNTGRLGCHRDYDYFREELLPLLESIHGAPSHQGKSPHRADAKRRTAHELAELKRMLESAIREEQYETAADLRDSILQLETDRAT